MKLLEFDELNKIYQEHGYSLYIVGGSVRDMLLGLPVSDLDFVTNATPTEEKLFLQDADFTFSKFGSIHLKMNEKLIDITTLRKENGYKDHRHPNEIEFVKTPYEDYIRRDFTINALYLDKNYNLLDYCGGLNDLNNKIVRFIGNPIKRIEEDPLRICRAERFANKLNFKIEEKTNEAINKKRYLLNEIREEKLQQEEKKGWIRK